MPAGDFFMHQEIHNALGDLMREPELHVSYAFPGLPSLFVPLSAVLDRIARVRALPIMPVQILLEQLRLALEDNPLLIFEFAMGLPLAQLGEVATNKVPAEVLCAMQTQMDLGQALISFEKLDATRYKQQ